MTRRRKSSATSLPTKSRHTARYVLLQVLYALGIATFLGTGVHYMYTLQAPRTWGTFTVTSMHCTNRHVCDDTGNWVSETGSHHFTGIHLDSLTTYPVGRSVRAYARLTVDDPSSTVSMNTTITWGATFLSIGVAAFLAFLMWLAYRLHKDHLADLDKKTARAALRAQS